MTVFVEGDRVRLPDGTLATFVKRIDHDTAVISVGYDSRIIDPVVLRKVER